MFARVLAAFALIALSTPALANIATELAAIDARMKECLDKNPANLDMKQCTFAAQDAADKVLNRVYRSFVERLNRTSSDGSAADDKETLKRLIASERAWIAYRDAECSLEGTQMLNGSGEGLIVGQCQYSMIRERAKSLADMIDQK